ncbi:YjgN family protein [Janthinobacterium aquaticum]|uniref:YjgN family protein n=1 Tax=Janthinobacterium sp. FT58W TaxID=2654254 RepID=UPI001D015A49|nr:YjgN family protein [Janthinobacterium sp. FT58W]
MELDSNNPGNPGNGAIHREAITFSATGSEYFRIWIVNLLLSIVTLGIYSAWAKVRRNRYFYSSTHLAGSSFEYHGNAVAILKGRIAAVVLIAGYNIALQVSPFIGLVMFVLMAAILPWLVWKSLQFKLYNTSYRGIRFGFGGSAKQAYKYFLWLPLLNMFTAGMMTPFLHQRLKRFQHTESRFGTSHFSFDATVGSFYKTYLLFFALLFGGLLVLIFVVFGSVFASFAANTSDASKVGSLLLAIGALYLYAFTVLPLFLTMIQNLIWNHTRLQQHQFQSQLTWGRTTFVMLTNLLGIVVTLGLFTPFAHVRWLKYRLESTALLAQGSLDEFVAATGQQVSATGEGVVDLLDFDLSI